MDTELISTYSVVVAGKRLARVREGTGRAAAEYGGEERTMQAIRKQRTQRASDFLENLLRRAYFGVASVAALVMLLLPLLPIPRETRLLLWLALTGASFAAACVLLLYWRGGDEERRARLAKARQEYGKLSGSRAGWPVRDQLTGLYSPEYWLHSLELRNGRYLRRADPVTCLMIGVHGLPELRRQRGDQAAHELLRRMALQIVSGVRPSDVVCRERGGRFAVALLRCSAAYAQGIAERLTGQLRQLLLSQNDAPGDRGVRLHWESATLPGDALTPVELLQVAGKSLDVKLSLVGDFPH